MAQGWCQVDSTAPHPPPQLPESLLRSAKKTEKLLKKLKKAALFSTEAHQSP